MLRADIRRLVGLHHHGPDARQIGRTEVCRNTDSLDFATPVRLSYTFEVVQNIRLDVFDHA